DVKSRTGTCTNNQGRLSTRVLLRHGDRVRMADYELLFVDGPLPDGPPPYGPFLPRFTARDPAALPPLAMPEGLRALLSSPESEREVRIPSDWQPGDRIEHRWEVQSVLGGGMGIV